MNIDFYKIASKNNSIMKKIAILLLVVSNILTGCHSNKLDPDTATSIIRKDLGYPKILDYDIYCSDPNHLRKIINAGLETTGLAVVQKHQKLRDVGSSLILLTDKATPYLLPTSAKDKTLNIQKVKIADEDIADVTIVENGANENALLVEYTTTYINVTPFAALITPGLQRSKRHRAYFSFQGGNWQLNKTIEP